MLARGLGDTVKTSLTTTATPGSLQAHAAAQGITLAQSFLDCDLIAIVDVSGSMQTCDAPGGRSRYAAACGELAKLQADHPGKVGVIAFSSTVEFVPGGVPPMLGGGTNLTAALEYALIVDGLAQLVVISDGEPNDEASALAAARRFRESTISCVYVGPEGGDGAAFLAKLARAKGGQSMTAAKTAQLAAQVERLLLN